MAYYGLDVEEYLEMAIKPRSYRGRPAPDPITREDARLILAHINDLVATRGIAPSTAKVTATFLVMFARSCPGFVDLTAADLKNYVGRIRKDLKQNTRRRYIPLLKRFVRWLVEEDHNTRISTKDLDAVEKIKVPGLDLEDRTAAKMLTGPEVLAMISSARNSRDRAILAMMYDGALRPIEVVAASWDTLRFPAPDEQRAQFNTAKKTGRPRYIPLINSVPYLVAWRNDYPGDPSGAAPLFVGLRTPHRSITQSLVKNVVYSSAKAAGISRDVNPYLMRHSRITHMLADEVPETIVKKIAWGSVRSHQLGTYTHLTDADVDRVLLAKAGIRTPEKKAEVGVRPRQCRGCGKINAATARYCSVCGRGLTVKAVVTRDDLMRLIGQAMGEMTPEELQQVRELAGKKEKG